MFLFCSIAPGSLTYRPWFVGVSVEIAVVSFEWNSFREGLEDVRSNCVGLNVLCLDAVVHAASRRARRNGVWGADLDGSISLDLGGALGLAVSDMVGNWRYRLDH